jgi:serine protease AprX
VTVAKSREAVAVDNAWALGMAVVKSAGNRGPGRATMTAPAEADGVVVVGATDIDDRGPGLQQPRPRG